MMSNLKSEEQNSVLDSEASVDYYVTTVNGQAPTKSGLCHSKIAFLTSDKFVTSFLN